MEPTTSLVNHAPTADHPSPLSIPQPIHPSQCAICNLNIRKDNETKHMNRAHRHCTYHLINAAESHKNIHFHGTYAANRWIDCTICAIENVTYYHCLGRKGLATHIRLKHPDSISSQLTTSTTTTNTHQPPPPLRLSPPILPPSQELLSPTS